MKVHNSLTSAAKSSIGQCSNELWTELTPEEGSQIAGGNPYGMGHSQQKLGINGMSSPSSGMSGVPGMNGGKMAGLGAMYGMPGAQKANAGFDITKLGEMTNTEEVGDEYSYQDAYTAMKHMGQEDPFNV